MQLLLTGIASHIEKRQNRAIVPGTNAPAVAEPIDSDQTK
jgi:hypothetical protein